MKNRFELMMWSPLIQLFFLMAVIFMSILLFQLIFSLILLSFSSIDVSAGNQLIEMPPGWSRIMIVFNQLGMFLFPALIFSKLYQKDLSMKLFYSSNKNPSFKLLLFFLLFIPSSILSLELFEFLNQELIAVLPDSIQESLEQSKQQTNNTLDHVLTGSSLSAVSMQLVSVALLPAIAEEFLFRGVLTRIFYQFTLNIHIAIVAIALFFAALHLQFHYLLPMWFMGIILGYVYYWTGSIFYSVLLHFINNSIAIIGVHYFQDISKESLDYITLIFGASLPLLIYFMHKSRNKHSLNTWYKY